jgi:hypothetical protein
MPIQRKKDKLGSFFRFGQTGKKYYYISGNKASRERAKMKAKRKQKDKVERLKYAKKENND